MKRKTIGIVAAVVLAAVGTFALIAYVESAKDDAVADEALVEVYMIEDAIARGTSLDDIESSVGLSEIPERLRADDAVTDLSDLNDDLVAAVNLRPGEQLLTSRLVDQRDVGRTEVPSGLQELTIALDPQRAVGGQLVPGDTVGIVLSFDPFDLQTSKLRFPGAPEGLTAEDLPSQSPNMTHLTFHKVLVTRVQFDSGEAEDGAVLGRSSDDDDAEEIDTAPSNQLLVSLALSSPEVEQVVFAAEFGRIWLTAEDADADESGTRVVTLSESYDRPPSR